MAPLGTLEDWGLRFVAVGMSVVAVLAGAALVGLPEAALGALLPVLAIGAAIVLNRGKAPTPGQLTDLITPGRGGGTQPHFFGPSLVGCREATSVSRRKAGAAYVSPPCGSDFIGDLPVSSFIHPDGLPVTPPQSRCCDDRLNPPRCRQGPQRSSTARSDPRLDPSWPTTVTSRRSRSRTSSARSWATVTPS